MDRIIPVADLKKAVDEAYEAYKSVKVGEVSPRNPGADLMSLGISVALTDGTTYDKADADTMFPMGSIVKVPISTILLEQNGKKELMKKSGRDITNPDYKKETKPSIPVSAHGIRAVSAIEPSGDPESKWNLIENRMIDMMADAPTLDEEIYKAQKKLATDANVENVLADAGFFLYDDASISIDLYLKAQAMKANTKMLAKMGATIAADGFNPFTKQNVFDGKLASSVVAMMADHGPHKMKRAWFLTTGLPAKSGFGGAIVAILPGVFSIAVYSPGLNAEDVSIKAIDVIAYIMDKLQISVFDSAKVVFK